MAVTDKDPTEAIMLVEQTVGTFNQIVVGKEGQMVPVPGYPDQPTLAERVKQNLKPSTDAAAGFAAQAAASAKAADDSAKLASQISGLETVSDAIALASLPLPDVWAPLTDSLRMFVGNGREVKIGDDVVARYVSFSRATAATCTDKNSDFKTAAINEPRFEKNGLLLEGGGTNLAPFSFGYDVVAGQLQADNYSTARKDGGVKITPAPGQTNKAVLIGAQALFSDQPSRPISLSVTVKADGYDMIVLGFRGTYTAAADNGIGVSLLDGSIKRTNHGLSVTQYEKLPDGFIKITVSTPAYTAGEPLWRRFVVGCGSMAEPYMAYSAYDADGVKGVIIKNFQLTETAFPQSIIPTSGAAATRAADIATLPQSLNLGESQTGFSLSVEFDTVNTGAHRILELSDFSSIIADGASITIRHAGKEVYGINAPLGKRHHLAYSVAADGTITVALDGKLQSPQARSGGAVSSKSAIILGNRWNGANDMAMYGHIRDLKIWTKKPLTSDQLKVASA
ncbi:phage head spike fiber domain-containing protein [Aeromonas sp. QDB11]|uniref:phage head spike fiber domain-containing protein n=1 Tax=Aeromonas sp. QDB11 TaxID=2990482 RepID=UPI0022E86083|nr:hypothetical protein [Aeromonas sp. QDB11]